MELVDPQSNIYRRPNVLRLGEVCQGHTHNFYHTTYVPEGGIRVRGVLPEGGVIERDVFAGDSVGIRQDVVHSLTGIGNLPAIERLEGAVRRPLIALMDQMHPGRVRDALSAALAKVDAEIEHLRQCNRYDCIYSHRDPQGEVIQHYDGWFSANI